MKNNLANVGKSFVASLTGLDSKIICESVLI